MIATSVGRLAVSCSLLMCAACTGARSDTEANRLDAGRLATTDAGTRSNPDLGTGNDDRTEVPSVVATPQPILIVTDSAPDEDAAPLESVDPVSDADASMSEQGESIGLDGGFVDVLDAGAVPSGATSGGVDAGTADAATLDATLDGGLSTSDAGSTNPAFNPDGAFGFGGFGG